MSKFQELYNADIARYGGKPELYIKIFLFLYRKAATASFAPTKFLYKALFRFWANRRGLELSVNQQMGETVLKVVVPDSYDPTTAGLPCPARKSK